MTKPYQVAVICKEANSLADQATCLRGDIRGYNATGISEAGDTEPMLWFNDRLTALEIARAELVDRLSSLGVDVREATAISQLYITSLFKAFEGLGDEVMSLGSDSTISPEDHTQSDGK